MRWWLVLIIGVTLAAIAFSRLWQLGTLPKGLHNDEASIGYNAYLISRSGVDEHGIKYPLYFKAFGEYKNPLHIYTTALLLKFLPLSEATVRLTSVIWFGLFIFILLLWVKDVFGFGQSVILYALIAAGFLPWFFPMSRIGLEVVTQLATTLLALWLVYLTYASGHPEYGWLAGFSLGLSIYSYSTSRPLVILITLAILGVYFRTRYWLRHLWLILGLAVALLPYLTFTYLQPHALIDRFKEVTYLSDNSFTQWDKTAMFLQNYSHYLSPNYLLFHGDATLRHHVGMGGEIYFSTAILAVLAISWMVTKSPRLRANHYFNLLLLILILAPLPAALTRGDSSLRSLMVGLDILLISIWGLQILTQILPTKIRSLVIICLLGLLLIEAGHYVYYYFTSYPSQSVGAMESYDFKTTLTTAIASKPLDIVVSNSGLAPYIQLAFYRLLLPPLTIPVTVGEPLAQPNRCIIYTPFGETIFNPFNLLPQLQQTTNFTKLICY